VVASDLRARAERLVPWFDLQFELVEALVATGEVEFGDAVTHFTNLHRRFGFGRPSEGPRAAEWQGFVDQLADLSGRSERLELTRVFAETRLVSDVPPDGELFGCFHFDPPNSAGIVRIHFAVDDHEDGESPLARANADRRRGELAEMFAAVLERHSGAASEVMGVSWLYNLEAYQRLFPPAYGASRRRYESESMTLPGMPFWGQFLDRDERVRPDLRAQFLGNLDSIDRRALWRLFPLPVMVARAPIEEFTNFYRTG